MKRSRMMHSKAAPDRFPLSGLLTHVHCFSILIWIFCSFNAYAFVDITPPGHLPGGSTGTSEDDRHLPKELEFFNRTTDTADNAFGVNTILTPLIRYWMPNFGPGGDHMTSVQGASESLPKDTDYEGVLYYVNASSRFGTQSLYRLLSEDSNMDHIDANSSYLPGYRAEMLLGYPYISAGDALAPIYRMVKNNPIDHLTAFYGELFSDYENDEVLGYGYPRFGEKDGEGKQHNPVLVEIAHKNMAISVDLSWGGVIYALWWNGKQFLNHYDCGRELQTALFKPGLGDFEFGPTEAGDRMYHGSPIADLQMTKKSIYTRSYPLQWDPRSYGGGANNPVLYGGEFDRQAKFLMYPEHKIISYTVGYKPAESTNYFREWVTAYLNIDVSSRFFVNTAEAGTEEIPMPANRQYDTRQIDEGAIITASTDLRYAIAFFTLSPAYISWYNFADQGSAEEKTRKINLWDTDEFMEAGTWYRRTIYVLVGTFDDVQNAISFLRRVQRFSVVSDNMESLMETGENADGHADRLPIP